MVLIAVVGFFTVNVANAAGGASDSRQATKVKTTKKVQAVDWTKSSETKAYPNLTKYPQAWLDVNIAKQRVYIRDGANHNQVLYRMFCSTGKDNSTPRGTYYIQAERGTHFYNASEKEGANFYVSWKNHGEYLFHTVPVDANGNYKKSVADNIGHKPSSHGCVQLTIPDAKWVYQNVPYGMKVVIH